MYLSNAFKLIRNVGIVVLFVWVADATADVRIRQLFQTDAVEIMGQVMPATHDTNTIWLSENNARLDAGDTAAMILLGDVGKLVQLDHTNKQYSEIVLGEIAESTDPQMKQMLSMLTMTVVVSPTGDKQKIGEWNCHKYIIEKKMGMMQSSTEVWATGDIEINTEVYHKILNSLMAYMPDYENAIKQFGKIKGLTVKETTTTEVMGQTMRSSSELVDVEKEDAPKDAFTIPEGYTQVAMPMPGGH
ncbi:MAG: DUF4412 domain-containing protein [candidate division Zixibacteria bacterium]|nr:DUF4412 domain-containing protein [candidate division Zixibacteria bacterium]MDH3939176.1 DUF4412 domain-containing protein [candidate division Zixibacteria bacterium]